MTIRELLEWEEHLRLDQNAAFSDCSKGRPIPEERREDEVRTCYQRDVDRIIHSKSFRRLMHKTQVFLKPEGDHYRTRMTHTIEVARIGRTIARALRLNEDLTEAIAMGHDLGHTPFGHAGEAALSECLGWEFHHNEQSLRVVDVLEKNGDGLNLSYEVRMGILTHTGPRRPETREAQIVRYADQIAYVNHDIDDAIRAGILTNSDIPADLREILGQLHKERINTLVCDIVENSRKAGEVRMSDEIHRAHHALRDFMFDHVYYHPVAKAEEKKARAMLLRLFEYYMKHPEALPEDFLPQLGFGGMERTVCDYIAGMTDKYAVDKYSELFIPSGWNVRG